MSDLTIKNLRASSAITYKFGEIIKAKVLGEDEELPSSSTSILNIIASVLGDTGEQVFFQQEMIKRELNTSDAILLSSLLIKLTDADLPNVFANPATTTFFLGFPKNEILNRAILDSTLGSNIKKVRLNKDCYFSIINQENFRFDHSIEIHITNYNTDKPIFKAVYDLSDKTDSGISNITNSVLNVKTMVYEGIEYIGFDVSVRQIERNEHIEIINTSSVPDLTYDYSDHLVGFEVLYKVDNTSDDSNYRKINCYAEGIKTSTGCNYNLSIDEDNKYIKIMFGGVDSSFIPAIRSGLKVIIYTTKGDSGNFTIPYIDDNLDTVSFNLHQNQSNEYEDSLKGIKFLTVIRTTQATGGRNQLSFEEIREYIINKVNNNKILSGIDVINAVKKVLPDANVSKVRHDLNMVYKATTPLRDTVSGEIISSGIGRFYFEHNGSNGITDSDKINAKFINPTYVFEYNESEKRYEYNKSSITYDEYKEAFNKGEITTKHAFFPFFLKCKSTSEISTDIYDMSVNNIYPLDVLFYDAISLDTVNLSNISLLRNPMKEVYDNFNKYGSYTFTFKCTVGDSLISSLKSYNDKIESGVGMTIAESYPIMNIRMVFTGQQSKSQFYADAEIQSIDTEINQLIMTVTLKTENIISDNEEVIFNDYSIIPVPAPLNPINFYFMDKDVDVQLMVMFKSTSVSKERDTIYDKFMSSTEIEQGYYIGYIYSTTNVSLIRNITEDLYMLTDVKLKQLEYERYSEDVYLQYGETVFERDEDGNIIQYEEVVELPTGGSYTVLKNKVLHKATDYVMSDPDEDGIQHKIVAHNKGDIILNEFGKPTVMSDIASMYTIIIDLPYTDRIYSDPDIYFAIRDAYYEVINNMNVINSILLDGITIGGSFKQTTGESTSYSVVKSDGMPSETLNDLSLSFRFSVSFQYDNLDDVDKDYNVELIKAEIKSFVYNNIDTELNISNLVTYIENTLPSVKSFNFISLNNYGSNVQAIVLDEDSSTDELINIKGTITSKDGTIIYDPDIEITVLN